VLRRGLLIGGLVVIVDLLTMLLIEQTANPDEIVMWASIDEVANYVLFSLLGVLVVRDTGVMLAGAVAGIFASLLDAIIVTAASLMIPPPPTLDVLEFGFAKNLLIGTLFAGLSGIVYALVQRWSDDQRRRR
jgi:cellobiose-specific phosphotransferase system component IIC